MLGTLSVGFLLDDALAAQLKAITGSDDRVRHGRPDSRHDAAARASRPRSPIRLRATASRDVTARDERLRRRCRWPRRRAPPARRPAPARGADPPVAHRAAAPFCRRFTPGWSCTAVVAVLLGDAPQLRRRADDHAPAGGHHRRDARGRGDRRPHAQDRPASGRPLGRRRRAAAGDDVQHADRSRSRASSARCRRRSGCRRSAGCRPSSRTKSGTR